MNSGTCWPQLPSADSLTEQVLCRHGAHTSWTPGSGGPALTWGNCAWGWRNFSPSSCRERTCKRVPISQQVKEIEHWSRGGVFQSSYKHWVSPLQRFGWTLCIVLLKNRSLSSSGHWKIIYVKGQAAAQELLVRIFLRVYRGVVYLWKRLNF